MRKIIYLMLVMLVMSSCVRNNSIVESETVMSSYEEKDTEYMEDFLCETNKGEIFSLYNRDDSKVSFINFWATWCGPCVREMPELQEVYDEYKDKVDFIFVNCGDSKEVISNFLNSFEENSYTFPIGYDENDELAIKYNITGIPTTYILTADNKISDMLVGARSGDDYRKYIDKVLKK